MTVSPAYISAFDYLSATGKSLKNMRNSWGPSIDPCGSLLYIKLIWSFVININNLAFIKQIACKPF